MSEMNPTLAEAAAAQGMPAPAETSQPAINTAYTIHSGVLSNIGSRSLLVQCDNMRTIVTPGASVNMPSHGQYNIGYPSAEHMVGAVRNNAEFVESTSDARTVNNSPGADPMRLNYRVLGEAEKQQMQSVKQLGAEFVHMIDALGSKREYSLAKTKVEEAVFWAVKGITE